MSSQGRDPHTLLAPQSPLTLALSKSCNKRLVTQCLLPPLLLAPSDTQLFDQLIIAMPLIRGSGHP